MGLRRKRYEKEAPAFRGLTPTARNLRPFGPFMLGP